MPHANIVAEILPSVPHATAERIIGESPGHDEAGVIIKATQGARWRRTDVDSLFDFAESTETFKGWLHYCEPGAGDAESESVWLMSSLGSRPLELGIWLELDDLGGIPTSEVSAWLTTLVNAVSTPVRPAALVVAPELVTSLVGLPAGLRLVLTHSSDLVAATPWAVRHPDGLECGDGVTLEAYELTSTRGLVPAAHETVPVGSGGTDGGPSTESAPEGSTGHLPAPEPDEEADADETEHADETDHVEPEVDEPAA